MRRESCVPSAFYVALSMALLLAAAGLLLWQWSGRRQAHAAATRHLVQHTTERASREEPAFDVRRGTALPVQAGGDPWASTQADLVASRKKGLEAIPLPGWMQGAIAIQSLVIGAVAGLVLVLLALLLGGGIAAAAALVLLLVVSTFVIWLRVQKMRRKLVSQLPGFIDSMVRLITIGNSTHAAFQISIASAKSPLREYMEGAGSLVRAGVDLDQALNQMASSVRIQEMFLLASILGLGVRYGGRADLLLERVAGFMRDREQAEHELSAMSAETRLSAWVLGLLPIGVGAAIIVLNPAYFYRMLNDSTGQALLFGAVGLQVFGALLLYRLARLA